jgi:hypothetical protein
MVLAGLVVPGGLAACDPQDLQVRMAGDIETASGVEVSNLWGPAPEGGGGGRIDLVTTPGSAALTTESFVETVHVIEEYRQEYRSLRRPAFWNINIGEVQMSVGWYSEIVAGEMVTSTVSVTQSFEPYMAYTDAFCELPDLESLQIGGPGNDLSRIDECNPKLQHLMIFAADQTVGYAGLAGLRDLTSLQILGGVPVVSQIPEISGLDELRIELGEDTLANRKILEDRLPGVSIVYVRFDPEGYVERAPEPLE